MRVLDQWVDHELSVNKYQSDHLLPDGDVWLNKKARFCQKKFNSIDIFAKIFENYPKLLSKIQHL